MPIATDPAVDTAQLASRLRLAVVRLARRLRQQGEPGISASLLSALSTIERDGPMTLGDLAIAERVQPPSMTRVVASLLEARLVRRTRDRLDGRISWVEVSTEGARLLQRSRKRAGAYLSRKLARLSPAELDVLVRAAEILERLQVDAD